ncbi:hypothetical protein CY34DRAFT_294678 [Suillus luteus UH-Slu-Lm8-n1]|uniref:Uncharacterized protein n=1 Tax=Suillus luteus UH-Slu-Lm8-n1 TaxID=930992 RepID=A0A0D0AZN5_9AGAM|nr:hypothetical protein CY34DRAFT_294678 [Suillus luteus UH-Slu-Lm8-n1]
MVGYTNSLCNFPWTFRSNLDRQPRCSGTVGSHWQRVQEACRPTILSSSRETCAAIHLFEYWNTIPTFQHHNKAPSNPSGWYEATVPKKFWKIRGYGRSFKVVHALL